MAEEVLAKREDDPAKTSAGPSGEGVGIIAASADIDKVTEASSSHSGSINAGRASQYGLNRGDLEEEVTQVIGVLSNWWGGVKKQSVSALGSLKADADRTMSQLQADFDQLKTARVEITPRIAENDAKEGDASVLKTAEQPLDTEATPSSSNTILPSASSLFGKISSSTSQLQQNFNSTLQATINSGSSLSPAQLRAQLAENPRLVSARENLQISMKQAEKLAEEYLKKGDQLVKGAEKWMEDAVKVVPPARGDISWDGSDWYTFTTSAPSAVQPGALFDAGSEGRTPRPVNPVMGGSRKDGLLYRLRHDESLLLVDPADARESAERQQAFKDWLLVWEKDGSSLRMREEGEAAQLRMALVPEHLTDDQFWQRYLFHLTMIEAGEAKRKQLLEETQNLQPEVFNWDDEPEESTTPGGSKPSSDAAIQPAAGKTLNTATSSQQPAKASVPVPSSSTSPRDSEESYDLVSDQGKKVKPPPPAEDDDDSDWE